MCTINLDRDKSIIISRLISVLLHQDSIFLSENEIDVLRGLEVALNLLAYGGVSDVSL